MKRKFSHFILSAPLLLFLATPAFADAEQPIHVHGDTVEYFHEAQKVVGMGHVSIDYENTLLEADRITVYLASKVAVAEGHVVLTQKGSLFKGERAEYNFRTKVGDVSRMNAEIPPGLYGKSQRIERVSESHYRAVDGYVTTCCGDSPLYRIQAHQVDIFPGEKVVIRNAVLLVKDVPILFIPFYSQHVVDIDRAPVQVIPGKNSEWGAFVLAKTRYHIVDRPSLSSKGNLLLDYRTKRGVGGGFENFFRGDRIGRGAARYYFIDDRKPPPDTSSSRTRVQWRHQIKLAPSTTLTTEINKLSDAAVIKDFFFREEYERNAFPDNYVSVITAKPEYTLSLLDRQRLDDFFSVVERSPEVRYDTHNQPFLDTPFYIRQEVQFSNLRRWTANEKRETDALRFDTNHTLSYAGHVGHWAVTPRVGTRQTFYNRDLASGRDLIRGTFDPGVDVSTRYYKTYDATVHALGLDYNRIRHIFSPTMSYFYRPPPTVARTVLQPFDSLDGLDKQNFLRFHFENKLQTKHSTDNKGTMVTREVARVIPFTDYDLQTGRLDNVGLDVELKPYPWLGIESDTGYDPRTGKVETENVDFYLNKGRVDLAVGQRYLRDESSQTTGQVKWRVSPEWSVKVYERYEFERKESKEFEVTLSKVFNCVIVDFTYNHRPANGDAFYFVVRLKSFPRVSFGVNQTYNHPKAPPRTLSQELF